MNNIKIELDGTLAKIDITKENRKFLTFVSDKRIEDLVTNFGNNIINIYSISSIDGRENIVFKDSNNNSLTFVIHDENQEYGLNYINYLINIYNEQRINFYEEEKGVRNINIALSTTDSYHETVNDGMANFVLYVERDKVSIEDLNFASSILEELVFNTYQNIVIKELEGIILIETEHQLITIPKILYLKVKNIINKRKKLRRLAFKKEGNKK